MVIEQIDIKQLRTLFKYVSDSPEVVDGIFKNHKIRFTQPAALNDPLEFNPAIRFNSEENNYSKYRCGSVVMPSIHEWYHSNLIESRMNNFGILSLTDNPYSFEMWCHYANGHKGFLLEFDIADKAKPTLTLCEGTNLKIHKVKYVKDYIVNIDKLERGNNSIPFYKIRDAIFLRKTKHWKHEREYRIVRKLSECDTYQPPAQRTSYRDNKKYLFPISLSCIANVIFGINTSQEVKRMIIEACKGTKINFLQTVIYKDLHNKIVFLPIDVFGPIEKYLKLLPQIFTYDSIWEKNSNNYITIRYPQEAPYYDLQPNDFDVYYRKKLGDIKNEDNNK